MSEHNPNNSPPLRVVFSPLGEKFEVSPANFYDLTRNANWTEQKPHPDTVRDHCEKHGLELPPEFGGEASQAPAPAPAPAPAETPTPVVEAAPAPVVEAAPAETPAAEAAPAETPAAEEQTASGEAPEEVQEADEAPALKTVPSDFADMDKDAVKAYIEATFTGTEIDGRKGRDALVAQALELAAARNA